MIKYTHFAHGQCLTFVDPSWFVVFFKDGVQCKKSLRTDDRAEAERLRDAFFLEVGATPRPHAHEGKPDRYIYDKTPPRPFEVKVPGKPVQRFATMKEARIARDRALEL